ncbi:hypothetical protein ABK040_012178 [Willaertia magna]
MVNIFKKKKIFGVSLDNAIKSSPILNGLPLPLTKCVDAVERYALEEEGIYRRTGSKKDIEDLIKAFDTGKALDLAQEDPFTICCVVKEYLKRLPEPLTTYDLYNKYMELGKIRNTKPREEIIEMMKKLIEKLPESNRFVLYFLMKHLHAVSQHNAENKMTITNIAIVFGPTLFRSTNNNPTLLLADVSNQSYCVDLLIREADKIFNSIGAGKYNNSKVAVDEDQELKALGVVSPSKLSPNTSASVISTSLLGSEESRRFSRSLPTNSDRRKGVSLLELKMNEETINNTNAGRGLFRPESTRIISDDNDMLKKKAKYTIDDVSVIMKDLIGESIESSASEQVLRPLDEYCILQTPKLRYSFDDEKQEIKENSPKSLDEAKDINPLANILQNYLNENKENSNFSIKAALPQPNDEMQQELEGITVDISEPLEGITKRVMKRREQFKELYVSVDIESIDDKWSIPLLIIEKEILKGQLRYFNQLFCKTCRVDHIPKHAKEPLRDVYNRYFAIRDIINTKTCQQDFISTIDSPLNQVNAYKIKRTTAYLHY